MADAKHSIRRVVTGQGPGAKSRIDIDGTPSHDMTLPDGTVVLDVWQTAAAPARLDFGSGEATDGTMALKPPVGGSTFRVADIAPATQLDSAASEALFKQMGSGDAFSGAPGTRGIMHRTETIDYGIILSGSMTLIMEDGETILNTGDVYVQRGSNHAWYNHTNDFCRLAVIMIDSKFTE